MDINKQRMIVTPILRLVFSLLSLVDTSEFYEVSHTFSLIGKKLVFFSSRFGSFCSVVQESWFDHDFIR